MTIAMLLPLFLAAEPPAAAAQSVLPLSLKRAVQIALAPEGSPRIALAEESIKLAEAQTRESKAALLPDVESSINDRRQTTNLRAFGFNFAIPIPGLVIPQIVGPFAVFDARATAQQPVFDWAALKHYQAAKQNIAAVKADFDAAKNQVSDQVARAYVIALRAGAAYDTAQANVDLSNALLKLAQSQKDAGTGTGIEVVRAQVQLANDRQRLVVADNDRRRMNLNLMRAMGLKLESAIELTDKLAYAPAEIGTLDDALVAARKLRAELNAQKDREQFARMNYNATRAEKLPSLAAAADYGAIGSDPANAAGTYTYGFTVKVPLFNGGRRQARDAETREQLHQEQTRLRDVGSQVELEVRLAFDSVRSAENEVLTAREGVELANRELEQARRRYAAGVTNSIEVTDAQTRLDRARDNQIAALYDYNVARIDLATATGKIQEYVNQ